MQKPLPPEKFVYLKSGPEGEGVQDLGDIASKPVELTIVPFYRLTRLRNKNSNNRPQAARRRIRPGRLPASAEHAPTPAHPPTCTLHTVDINSPR